MPATGKRTRRSRDLLPLLPVVLLAAVALNQIRLARTAGLSPWLGGGFGMFATAEHRRTHVFAEAPWLEREVSLPPALADLERRARELPRPARLERLARALAEREARRLGRPPEAIRVEIWRTRFEPESLAPRDVLLRRYVLEVSRDRR